MDPELVKIAELMNEKVQRAQTIVDKYKGALIPEDEQSQVDAFLKEVDALQKQYDLMKDLGERKAFLENGVGTAAQKGLGVHGAQKITPQSPGVFGSLGEFLISVVKACTPGGVADPRLGKQATFSDSGEVKATGLSEGIDADGGFLVGTEYSSEMLQKTYDNGRLLSLIRKYSLTGNSNSMKINGVAETSRAAGSRWGGVLAYWKAEAAAKTASGMKFEQIEFALNKLIGLCYSTDELLQDAPFLASFIRDVFQMEFEFQLEDGFVNGTGSGQMLGIMNSPALVTVAKEAGQAADSIVAENIFKMYSRAWARSRPNMVWLINQDVEPSLFSMFVAAGTGGVPVYLPANGLSGAPYGTLMGRPVIPVEYCQTLGTKGDILFVDPKEYLIVDKGGMQSESSIHVRFVYDESAFRFVYRVDGAPLWRSALTPYKGSNTVSPFIALAER